MISPTAHELFRKLCGDARRITLTTHIQPDGDALGSELSLGRFLLDQGKQVRIVNQDPTAANLRFLETPDLPIEVYGQGADDESVRSADLVVLVDNAAPDRLGRLEPLMLSVADKTLCIDHHPSRGTPWAHPILDEASCATAAMIYELTEAQGWTPDRSAAEAIYVGLATDTGFFRFNSTTARAHEIAARLLGLGVDPAAAYQTIHEHNSLAFTRLLGHALVGLELLADGAIGSVVLSRELIDELGAEDVDTSEIATSLLAMDGLVVALLFRELPDSRVKVSLRSKGDIDVHMLAGEFGGGGHRNASGIVIDGPLSGVVATIVERTGALLSRG